MTRASRRFGINGPHSGEHTRRRRPLLWSVAATAVALLGLATATSTPASAARGDDDLVLYGTTGRCNNPFPGGPCTETSVLVQLDPATGALKRTIGPVGYTVNGLAWDARAGKLLATTAIGDVAFHGLITIDLRTGAGRPVNAAATNFGLAGNESPIHSLTIDRKGRLSAWYDEFPVNVVTDTYVTIDKRTGIATEFGDTGVQSNQNGLTYDQQNRLWNIDTPRGVPATQTALLLDPANGHALLSVPLTPPTMAALGDINPADGRYYGLQFTPFDPAQKTTINVVTLPYKCVEAKLRGGPKAPASCAGQVTALGPTVDNLHTLAFAAIDD